MPSILQKTGRVISTQVKSGFRRREFEKTAASYNPARTIILANTASYRNLGDHAITLGELAFLTHFFPSYSVLEITSEAWRSMRGASITSLFPQSPAVLLHGGGYLGTLWSGGEERTAMSIIASAGTIPCVYFPQTVYYSENAVGHKALRHKSAFYAAHDNTSFILRDQRSFDFTLGALKIPKERALFAPDIALFLQRMSPAHTDARSGALLCLRQDEERAIDNSLPSLIKRLLCERGMKVSHTDTVAPDFFSLDERKKMVEDKLEQFASSCLVVTDRLHALIFCAITQTPCIALNNINGKVGGVHHWIEGLPYLRVATPDQIGPELIESVLAAAPTTAALSPRELLMPEFNRMAHYIASTTNLRLG